MKNQDKSTYTLPIARSRLLSRVCIVAMSSEAVMHCDSYVDFGAI